MIAKLKNFFRKNTLVTLCLLFLFVCGGAIKVLAVVSAPPDLGGYPAGTVLDPGCGPEDPNCFITPTAYDPNNVIIINPYLPKIEGKRHQEIQNAIDWIVANGNPSPSNIWAIKVSGKNTDNFILTNWINIIGEGMLETELAGEIDISENPLSLGNIIQNCSISNLKQTIEDGSAIFKDVFILGASSPDGEVNAGLIMIGGGIMTFPGFTVDLTAFNDSLTILSAYIISFDSITLPVGFKISTSQIAVKNTGSLIFVGGGDLFSNEITNIDFVTFNPGTYNIIQGAFSIDNIFEIPVGTTITLGKVSWTGDINVSGTLYTAGTTNYGDITETGGTWTNLGDTYDNRISNLSATEVQGAIDELAGMTSPITVVNTTSLVSTGLVGAGEDVASLSESIFLGLNAGYQATNVSYSNFFGSEAGKSATNASGSNFFGDSAGKIAINAGASNFFGNGAGYQATNANYATFLGQEAGYQAANASQSNFFGYKAGSGAINAKYSIFIGNLAGSSWEDQNLLDNTSGGSSILIGGGTSTGGFSNSIVLGTNGANTMSNQFLVPASYVNWQIAGVDYVMPGAQGGSGQVLKNDGAGNLTWEDDSLGVGDECGSYYCFDIDVDENMYAGTGAGSDGSQNLFIGINAGSATSTGYANSAVGYETLKNNTSGHDNFAFGWKALYSNTTGYANSAVGTKSLYFNDDGANNSAYGDNTLYHNTSGYGNVAIGEGSLYNNLDGFQNISIGQSTLLNNISGEGNTAVGLSALRNNVAGSRGTAIGNSAMFYSNDTLTPFINYNVAVGYEALRGSTTAANNTGNSNNALGYQTLFSNTTGSQNIAIGTTALYRNTTGNQNSAIGFNVLFNNTTGRRNTANGDNALFSNIGGEYNIANGFYSLYSNTTGNNNIAFGPYSLYTNSIGSSNVALGYSAGKYETGSNTFYLDNQDRINTAGDKAGALLYGTFNATPANQTLTVNGKLYASVLSSGTGGAGYDAICIDAITHEITVNTGGDDCVVSSARFKENIFDLDLGLSFVNLLQPRTFNYINSNEAHFGFIAEEIAKLDSRLIFYENDGITPRGVRYQDMTAVLAKSIQELDLKVEDLIIEKQNLFSNLISWFGNIGNGIGDFFANRIRTKEICVGDETGETCITKSQLDQILSTSGAAPLEPSVALEIIPDPEVPTCEELGNCPIIPESESDLVNTEVSVDEANPDAVADAGVVAVE